LVSTTTLPVLRATRSRHEALLWSGTDELLAGTLPFIEGALASGAPIMVAVPESTWEPIRGALGADSTRVRYVDMASLGANPGRIIPAWLAFLEEHGRPARGIGESLWAGRREAEAAECHVYEATLNLAVPLRTPLWLLCPYNTGSLDPATVAEARRTHPLVATPDTRGGAHPVCNDAYRGVGQEQTLGAPLVPRAPRRPDRIAIRHGWLGAVRQFVVDRCAHAGLGQDRTDDLVLAVNELAANTLDHGGGRGILRSWRDDDALYFEVHDSGRIKDPLVGRVRPAPYQERGRGLWIVNQLCDLLQVRSTRSGNTLRVVTWLRG
jgi:anti-sigma regulatory factor (Ser/Thr protein kinase)